MAAVDGMHQQAALVHLAGIELFFQWRAGMLSLSGRLDASVVRF